MLREEEGISVLALIIIIVVVLAVIGGGIMLFTRQRENEISNNNVSNNEANNINNINYTMTIEGFVYMADIFKNYPETAAEYEDVVQFNISSENATVNVDDIVVIRTSTKEMQGVVISVFDESSHEIKSVTITNDSFIDAVGFAVRINNLDRNSIQIGDKIRVLSSSQNDEGSETQNNNNNNNNNSGSTNTNTEKLFANADGYIHINCLEFWKFMNTDSFRDNLLKISTQEFYDEYNGKKFAISGTLKFIPAFDRLILYHGNTSVEGGSKFDYNHFLNSLGVARNREYDGKNVIIRTTLTLGVGEQLTNYTIEFVD